MDFFVLVLVVFFVFVFFPLASVPSVVVVVDVEALDFEPVLLSCAKASVANIRGRTNIPVKSNVVSFFMLIISSIVGGFIPPI